MAFVAIKMGRRSAAAHRRQPKRMPDEHLGSGPAAAHARQDKAQAVERCLACEAVVSKADDRADSRSCRALGREEAQILT
jgi:hypothetical protein